MAEEVEFQLHGLDSLIGKLEEISGDMKFKGGRYALRKAAQVVRDAARANAKRLDDPETFPDISANIVERWNGREYRRSGDLAFKVGVMGGAGGTKRKQEQNGLPGGDTRHFRHVEFGTQKTPAQPFMRPALENNLQDTADAFVIEYEHAVDRAIKRAQKKAGVQ